MPSPIEPASVVPPPTSIPLPSGSVKQRSSNSPEEESPVSPVAFEMGSLRSMITVQEPQRPADIQGPSPRVKSSHEDRSLELEWQNIQKLRIEIFSLRSQIHQLRSILRGKQLAKSNAEDLLLQYISTEGFEASSRKIDPIGRQKILVELTEACRTARGEYGPVEDDCNRLEDHLSEQEFNLTRQEEHFYRHGRDPLSTRKELPAFASFHRRSPSFSQSQSTVTDVEEVPREHPLVIAFLSRMGDLDLLQERLVELEEEQEGLESERDCRELVGMTLGPDDQAWLEKSQSLLNDLLDKIQAVGGEVSRLRQECRAKDLIDEYDEPTDFQSQEQTSFKDEVDMNSKDQISEYVKHPILLPKPGSRAAFSKSSTTGSDEKAASLGSRVNQWILDQLRESPLEVNLLERTFEGRYGKLLEGWEVSVLDVWNEDGTANTIGYHVYTSSMTTQAPVQSDQLSDVSDDKHKHHSDSPIRFILAQRQRLSPSPDHSHGTKGGPITDKLQASRRKFIHRNST